MLEKGAKLGRALAIVSAANSRTFVVRQCWILLFLLAELHQWRRALGRSGWRFWRLTSQSDPIGSRNSYTMLSNVAPPPRSRSACLAGLSCSLWPNLSGYGMLCYHAGRTPLRHSHLQPAGAGGLVVSAEVAAALAAGRPVVALESTIISHGMPYPQNLETARQVRPRAAVVARLPAPAASTPCTNTAHDREGTGWSS